MASNQSPIMETDDEPTGPLEFLQPRETRRILKARGPRHISNLMRRGLPIAAGLLLAALIAWPMLNPNKVAKAVLNNIPDLVIQNLHFTGLDSKSQPYSISAATATRPQGSQNIYDLDKPKGEITLQNGSWIAGQALRGRYDQETRKLWLGGDVQLFHDKGFQFTTDDAQVDIDGNFAWGEKPVFIQGDFGEIRGQGFRLLDNGNVMVVKGPAKAVLSLHGGNSSDKPAAEHK